MDGGSENNSPACAIKAAATLPDRCAWRPASSGKASKMPKVDGPRRMPNQAVVAGSSMTRGRPPLRKLSTSFSFPGFASRRTNNATVTMTCFLSFKECDRSWSHREAQSAPFQCPCCRLFLVHRRSPFVKSSAAHPRISICNSFQRSNPQLHSRTHSAQDAGCSPQRMSSAPPLFRCAGHLIGVSVRCCCGRYATAKASTGTTVKRLGTGQSALACG